MGSQAVAPGAHLRVSYAPLRHDREKKWRTRLRVPLFTMMWIMGHLGDWFNALKSPKPRSDHIVMKWAHQQVDRRVNRVKMRCMSGIALMTTLEFFVHLTDP